MSKSLEKITQIISSSSISPADQNDLLIFLPILPDEVLNDLCNVFEKNSSLIKDFNDNFKARLDILINGRDKWDKLIAQEEEMLDNEEKEIF
ncbi:hypothetical protein IID20_02385 [Patescibacteria group bacterium]|nr:hypothetical protein [Patescibacteria group bacterium]